MKNLKVLVIEDMAAIRQFMKFCLDKSFTNVSIVEAETGREARAKLEQEQYDLVLCDWGLPDISGEEILQWMKDSPSLRETPFIMVTSKSDRESVIKAVSSGVSSYVVKPFTADSLAQKISAVVDTFDRREHERIEADGTITLHNDKLAARGNIIEISMGGVFGMFSRQGPLPGILDRALIDVSAAGAPEVKGIEGFVIRIQAAEASPDTEEIRIAFRFLELSPEKRGELESVLTIMQSQGK